MTEQAGTLYKIRGDDPYDWVGEANRIFELMSVRMDNLEGYRGHPTIYNYIESMDDVVIVDSSKGVVLKDSANPANFWRITINAAGTLVVTNIGRIYP
jgi:hypothetical protein